MRCALLPFVLALGCGGAGEEGAPPRAPSIADARWVLSDKLDADAKEFVLRAYDVELAFPFVVRLSGGAGARDGVRARGVRLDPSGEAGTVVARPAELAELVADARVAAVRCAPPRFEAPASEAWRDKVDPDVRTVVAAGSGCWTAVTLKFGRDAGGGERAELERAGVVLHAFDARTAIGFAPVRGVAHVAELAFVERVEQRAAVIEEP